MNKMTCTGVLIKLIWADGSVTEFSADYPYDLKLDVRRPQNFMPTTNPGGAVFITSPFTEVNLSFLNRGGEIPSHLGPYQIERDIILTRPDEVPARDCLGRQVVLLSPGGQPVAEGTLLGIGADGSFEIDTDHGLHWAAPSCTVEEKT